METEGKDQEFEGSGDPAGTEGELTEQSAGEADPDAEQSAAEAKDTPTPPGGGEEPAAGTGGGDGGAAGGLSREEMLEKEGVASTGPDPEQAKPESDEDQVERMDGEGGPPSETSEA
jgi:hypothetical protein